MSAAVVLTVHNPRELPTPKEGEGFIWMRGATARSVEEARAFADKYPGDTAYWLPGGQVVFVVPKAVEQ